MMVIARSFHVIYHLTSFPDRSRIQPNTLKPVFVIELDDSSHKRPDRIERDSFVKKVFEEARIPLVRILVRNGYDTNELGALFRNAIQKYVTHKNKMSDRQYTIDNPPLCRKHGVGMVLRTARQTGEKFWGCPNYPQCKEIIKLQGSSTWLGCFYAISHLTLSPTSPTIQLSEKSK